MWWKETVRKLEHVRWGGSNLREWLAAAGALIIVWVVTRSLHALVASRLKAIAARTNTQLDDLAAEVVHGTRWYFHGAFALMVAKQLVVISKTAAPLVHGLIVLCFGLQLGVWLDRAIAGGVRIWSMRLQGRQNATMAAGIVFIARLVIWATVVLLILSNWGFHVGAVVAGLGVGGIAAALAVQGILSDLFAGLSMYFDRPFDIGDFVVVADLRGTVTKIGLRTTRLQSLDGEEIVMPNGELVKSRIKNFARMQERRVVLAFGVQYGTAPEKLEKARTLVTEIICREELARLDRGHFKGFGPTSLEFEFVYFVLSPDYTVFMDLQQRVSFALYRAFSEAEILFAFPTQTLHVASFPDVDWARNPDARGDAPVGMQVGAPTPREAR